MPEISEIFAGGKLSYEEFRMRAGEMGAEIGDVAGLRQYYEDELLSLRSAHELEREMAAAGVKNRDLFMKVIDMSGVTVDEGGFHGIREQIDALRVSDPYLFEDRQAKPVPKLRMGMPHQKEVMDADAMSDREFYRAVKKL